MSKVNSEKTLKEFKEKIDLWEKFFEVTNKLIEKDPDGLWVFLKIMMP